MDRPEAEHTLGSYLRSERERRGITVEQLAASTKIAIKYLHALEADQFNELPALPFVRGFISSYARFLSLDPKQTLVRFDQFLGSKVAERPARDDGHRGYAFEPKDGEQRSRLILSVVLGTMAIAGATMLILRPSSHSRKRSQVDRLRPAASPEAAASGAVAAPTGVTVATVAPAEGQAEASKSVATPAATLAATPAPTPVATSTVTLPKPSPQASAASPVPSATPSVSATPGDPLATPTPNLDPLDSGKDYKLPEVKHKLAIKTLADLWVRYQVDDKPMRKFLMRKGSVLILKSKQKLVFQISNPKSATANYNGMGAKRLEDVKGLAQFRETATLVYPREAVDSTGEPFANEKPLTRTADPETASPDATPTPQPTASP